MGEKDRVFLLNSRNTDMLLLNMNDLPPNPTLCLALFSQAHIFLILQRLELFLSCLIIKPHRVGHETNVVVVYVQSKNSKLSLSVC